MTASQHDRDGARERFDRLAADLLHHPLVQTGTGFGSLPGLRVHNKIFAMLCRGELVVKLPQPRVEELVARGLATRFDARGDGRLMKQWAAIPATRAEDWNAVAAEALTFMAAEA